MHRLVALLVAVLTVAAAVLLAPVASRTQAQFQMETPLTATRRFLPAVGPGFRTIARGPGGRYYVLTAPGGVAQIYDADGERVGQVPVDAALGARGARIVYGEWLDVDATGRVVVCDRAANAVKIYSPEGMLSTVIPVNAPLSAVLLPGGEVAVASPETPQLVTVYDLAGKQVRQYGEPEEISERVDVNRQANRGRLAGDAAGNSYFSFEFLPEPTVRKFDRAGYLVSEISLMTLEFEPAAQSARRAIARSAQGTPALHRIITAVGVDPATEDVWLAIGTLLMHFDKEGQRKASFRTYTPAGARLAASSILVEPDRLLLGADPQGIYEFPRPQPVN